ncbi:MAG: Type IV secretory pathway VirB4 component-like protein, partial [Candidatus Collierbacteria bacterium GW2011_GWC2_44_18]
SSYLQINDRYVRTLFVSGYPYVASTGWLNNLINFNHDIDISYHIEQVDPLIALPKLNRKITELESTKRTMLKEGRVIGSEITDPLESAMELKDKIQRGMEKLFQISIYMTISADSLSELNKNTKLLETVMQTRLFYIKPATFQQIEANPFCQDLKTNLHRKETWIALVQRLLSPLFHLNWCKSQAYCTESINRITRSLSLTVLA